MTIEARVKRVMSNVFNIDENAITESTSLDTLDQWTSLGQMNLVIALEEEFSIQLTDTQVLEMMSYPLIILIIKEAI